MDTGIFCSTIQIGDFPSYFLKREKIAPFQMGAVPIQDSFTLSDFSKRQASDFLLSTIDTGIFNSAIHNEQFSRRIA